MESSFTRVVSIDVGIKNFAIYAEDVDMLALGAVIKRPQKNRKLILPDEDILNQIYMTGTAVSDFANVYDLSENDDGTDLSSQVRKNLFEILKSLDELWRSTHTVIIEGQFINTRGNKWGQKGPKPSGTANMKMIKLAESCFSWLVDNYYPSLTVEYYPSHKKTIMCLCPKTFEFTKRSGEVSERKTTKPDRKKWAIQKGKSILSLREDYDLVKKLEEKKRGTRKQKLDDICDCIIQLQAYKWDMLVPLTKQ